MISVVPEWMADLEEEDVAFIRRFLLASGSLKEVAGEYGVSYPTVRLRLDRLIQKISLADRREEEPFLTYIRSLAVDARIDLETAKDIMGHYRKEARESAQEKGERTE